MAKQRSILPLDGTIQNITFYESMDGFLAKEKGGVDKKRIAKDPAFQRTRENGVEFGKAGLAGKLLRTALRSVLRQSTDKRMVSRLTRQMMEVIQGDETSSRGQRNVIDGEATLLEGFEFNIEGKLGTTLYAPSTATIDRVAGQLKIDLPAFVPMEMIAAPDGATHFKIVSAGAEIDFVNGKYVVDSKSTEELPWNEAVTAAISLSNAVTANSIHPLFLSLGIEFFQEMNGANYRLKNGAFNAHALVKVEGE